MSLSLPVHQSWLPSSRNSVPAITIILHLMHVFASCPFISSIHHRLRQTQSPHSGPCAYVLLSLLRTFLISSILFTVYRLCCLLISHILSTVIPPIPSQSDTLPHFSAVHISLSSSSDVFRIHPKSRALSFARLTTLVPCSVLWALQFIALALSSRSLMLILDNVSFCVNRFLVFYLLSLPAVFVCRVPHKCNLTRFECPFLSNNIRGI